MKTILRSLGAVAALAAAGSAAAHTGHATTSVFAGLAHPFGLDHLLAMVAVGVWSAAALPAGRWLVAPALFMLALTLGALAGAAGVALPFTESAIAASVALFGLMLLGARQLPAAAGLALVAAAGALHGLAHGAELPAGGTFGATFGSYALGFLATTALLHASGLTLGRVLLSLQRRAWQAVGAGIGLSGLVMLMARA